MVWRKSSDVQMDAPILALDPYYIVCDLAFIFIIKNYKVNSIVVVSAYADNFFGLRFEIERGCHFYLDKKNKIL